MGTTLITGPGSAWSIGEAVWHVCRILLERPLVTAGRSLPSRCFLHLDLQSIENNGLYSKIKAEQTIIFFVIWRSRQETAYLNQAEPSVFGTASMHRLHVWKSLSFRASNRRESNSPQARNTASLL